MTIAVPRQAFAAQDSAWRRHLLALAGAWAVLLVLFRREVADMIGIWWTSSTFGHCLLIGPIIGWLVWQRRPELSQLEPVAWWPGLALVGLGGIAWLLGDAASVAFARQAGLVAMLAGAVVTLLGLLVARGLAFPLCYAAFLVPFGEWLEPPLQQVTVSLVMPLLALVGIPATSDGVMIHAGRYYFEVAEACSGAKFVLAMSAFGVLVANLCFTSWWRRAVFLAACLVVPVLANGARAFATIWVADLTSVEAAAGFDHIVYGWIFFGLVMAALLWGAWRWFDRPADAPAFDPAELAGPVRAQLPLGLAVALLVGVAIVMPAWSMHLKARSVPTPRIALPEVPGWHRVPLSRSAPWRPWYPGASGLAMTRYADGRGNMVDMAVAAFTRQEEGRELVGYGVGVLGANSPWLRVGDGESIAGGSTVRIRAPAPADRLVATWYRVGGITTADPSRVKLETLRIRLLGGSPLAIALHVSTEVRPGHDPAEAIRLFLSAAGPPPRLIERSVLP